MKPGFLSLSLAFRSHSYGKHYFFDSGTTMDLTFQIKQQDDWEYIFFNGEINEDAEVSLAGIPVSVRSWCRAGPPWKGR